MPEHIQYEDDKLFNPETHHEETDVPVRALFWSMVVFVIFSVVVWLVILFMYKGLANMERSRMDPPQSAVPKPANADVPQNQPLLQPFPHAEAKGSAALPQRNTPVTDLIHMRAEEEKVLGHYGWVDKRSGVVHIPIEEAKKLTAAKLALQAQVGGAAAPAAAPQPVGSAPTTAPAGTTAVPGAVIAPPASTATHGGAHQ